MSEHDLRSLLEGAAAGVPKKNLVEGALAGARRRRIRRRSASVAVAATLTAAVIAVGASGLLTTDSLGPVDQTSSVTPTASDPTVVAEDGPKVLRNQMVADRWVPSDIYTLPWHASPLPRLMTGKTAGLPALSNKPMEAAVTVVSSPDSLTDMVAISTDGQQSVVKIRNAEPLVDEYGHKQGLATGTSLSQDGRRLAVLQPDAVVIVALSTGSEQRFAAPNGVPAGSWAQATTQWSADGNELLVAGTWALDLTHATWQRRPYNIESDDIAYAPDGSVIVYFSDTTSTRILRQYLDGTLVAKYPHLEYLGVLRSLQASDNALAAVREVVAYALPRQPSMMSGVVVLTHTGDARALLPMSDDASRYSNAYGYLVGTQVLGWVDDRRILIAFGAPTEVRHLVIWNFLNGELTRIADVARSVQIHAAAHLLN